MTEVPTSAWVHDFDMDHALAHAPRLRGAAARWRRVPGSVRHVFTHFPLELGVYVASVGARVSAPRGTRWVSVADFADEALPNVMRKVIDHAGVLDDPERRTRGTIPRLPRLAVPSRP
jgi:A/G-specific adenine glycosylase